MLVEGWREGGFWRPDAFVVAMASAIVLTVAVAIRPLSGTSWAVVGSLVLLVGWWLVRAHSTGSSASFLPLGASILGFVAAFAVVRCLDGRHREVAAMAIVGLGAAGALTGFVGMIWRWYPLAMPSQQLWRLSTTLTYADAAGIVLAVSMLLALGSRTRPWAIRGALCLCAGGLIATQSRGPLLALVCAAPLVPIRQYRLNAFPLIAGISLGVVAVASSGATQIGRASCRERV